MTNIVKTNNQQLRLAQLSVGLLSTLRIAFPMVPQSATNVEVIVTSGDTHNAYAATFDSTKGWWLCDIDASQFPTVGRQKYEVAYKIAGDQFWDGQGWIEIVKATTSGITPAPLPDPYRYVVVTVNGYGATEADGAVRIPKLNIGTEDPSETTGYIEGDQYFNRTSGAQWVLCSVTGTLTWVKCASDVISVNGKVGAVSLGANDVGAYTKGETDAALANKLDKTIPTYNGNLASLTADGNLADSGKNASDFLPASSSSVGTWDVYDMTTFRGDFSVGPSGELLGITSSHGSLYKFGDNRWYYGERQDPASEIAVKGDISALESSKADRASLAPEYSTSAAYPVGSIVYHDGNIYQCTTAIADGGEAWNADHWQLMKLSDFFTSSNSLLTGLIESKTRGKADQSDLDALAAKVDTANAALEEVA